jgi:multimeric flavodoxin WrbA
MASKVTRRKFLRAAGSTVAAGTVAGAATSAPSAQDEHPPKTIKIVGIACSPRKGKTTAAALRVCLDAAKAVAPERIDVEMIELAGMKIDGSLAVGGASAPGAGDDFPQLVPKLADPKVAGIIVGSPVYFCNMSALCKAFLDRCFAFRAKQFALANKVAGVVAVGGVRNGGQELTIQSIQAALLCQEMTVVGDGRPTAHTGATLLNDGKDDISKDEFGIATAKNLGRRVAEVALARVAVAR